MAACCNSGTEEPDGYVPRGKTITTGRIQVYESRSSSASSEKGILLMLPDGFGHVTHNFILADIFAEQGWHVLVPDYWEGDALPIQFLRRDPDMPIDEHPWPEEEKQKLRELDFDAWLSRHNSDRISSLLDEFVIHISQRYPGRIVVGVGYCTGGKHVLRLAKEHLKVAVAFHPSFVQPEDMDNIQAPLYVGLAEKDTMVPETLAADLQAWSKTRMVEGVPFTLEIYPDVGHGFAARPDSDDDNVKRQYRKALQNTLAFLASHMPAYSK